MKKTGDKYPHAPSVSALLPFFSLGTNFYRHTILQEQVLTPMPSLSLVMANDTFTPMRSCLGAWPELESPQSSSCESSILNPSGVRRTNSHSRPTSRSARISKRTGSWTLKQVSPAEEDMLNWVLSRSFDQGSVVAGRNSPSHPQTRTPENTSSVGHHHRPSIPAPSNSRSSGLSTPGSRGSSSRSIFSTASISPSTPGTPPLSPTQSRGEATGRESVCLGGTNDASETSYPPSPLEFPFPPSRIPDSSPCPPSRSRYFKRHSPVERTSRQAIPGSGTSPPSANSRFDVDVPTIHASPVSKFTPCHKQGRRTLDTLDRDIAKRLIDGPATARSNNSKAKGGGVGTMNTNGKTAGKSNTGFVYVICRDTSEGFVKIGQTIKLEKRLKQISQGNSFGKLIFRHHINQRPFQHFAFSERIIQDELYNIRHISEYTASPQGDRPAKESGYTEWYQISDDQANEVVAKWRDWLDRCDPYDDDGYL